MTVLLQQLSDLLECSIISASISIIYDGIIRFSTQ